MNQEQKNTFAKSLGIDPRTQAILDAGSDHKFSCRCDLCREWWRLMGPEDDGTFGPFTKDEIGWRGDDTGDSAYD